MRWRRDKKHTAKRSRLEFRQPARETPELMGSAARQRGRQLLELYIPQKGARPMTSKTSEPQKLSFLTAIKEIRRRARQHIQDGAVTDSYKGDRTVVLRVLNEALATKIVCVLRYKAARYSFQVPQVLEKQALRLRSQSRDVNAENGVFSCLTKNLQGNSFRTWAL